MNATSQLETIFFAALEKGTAEERAAYLHEACVGDEALQRRIERMIEAQKGSFLVAPAIETSVTAFQSVSEGPGTQIGPYKLLQEIGEGGMGVVFMAEQTQPIQRKVALKVIKPGMDSRQVIARFEAERQALAMMDHVNIARVLDAGATDSGRPYFVMELVHGIPITKYCDDNRLAPRERLELFIPVCQAIQHAHQKGIIHRDIKPSNVMVTLYDGKPVPKVIDFGVAKATEQRLTERTLFTQYGTMVGTPEYMSPEQAEMSALGADTRSDIFSLGVLLYELLTGSTPLSHKRIKEAAYGEVLRMIREEEPPKPSTRLSESGETLASISAQRHMEPLKLAKLMRGELDWIVMKTLEKDRNRRYETAKDFAADVQNWLQDLPISVRAPSLAALLRVWLRQNFGSTGWAVAIGVIWGLVGGAFIWLVMLNPLELSIGARRALYWTGVVLLSIIGPAIVWLVRPKNAAADVAAGTIAGTLAAVITYTLSWGWVAVSIAGVRYGIALGMTTALAFKWSLAVIETLAAGMLFRRKGNLSTMLGAYVELIIPTLVAVTFANNALFWLGAADLSSQGWFVFTIPLLLLAIVGVLKALDWRVRALLHVLWITSVCAFAITYGQ